MKMYKHSSPTYKYGGNLFLYAYIQVSMHTFPEYFQVKVF